ncbi:MAG: AI-2E family transporter [Elusimicrobia bacterium]|nr:AI-2E family transporter [Candidatus Liberimonas magnetica]
MEADDKKSCLPDTDRRQKDMLSKERFSKYFLLGVFIISLLIFLYIIKIFILDITLAVVLATFFYPLFKNILRIFRNKHGISALLTCVIILLVFLIPLVIISNIIVIQSKEFYHLSAPQIKEIIERKVAFFARLQESAVGDLLSDYGFDWQNELNDVMKFIGTHIATVVNKTSQKAFKIIFDLFIILFATFYFLKDGQRILVRIKNSIPLNDEYKENIISKFSSVLDATVKGVFFIAILQSSLATVTLWAFGIKAWLLWGGVMLVLSTIPFVGTGFVLVPTGIIKIVNGDIGSGIAIIIISLFFISLIDNFIRPRIVGHYAGMHDLVTFFGIVGGISVFGPVGIIIGPIIIAIFVTILEIYNIEFYEHINYSKRKTNKNEIIPK